MSLVKRNQWTLEERLPFYASWTTLPAYYRYKKDEKARWTRTALSALRVRIDILQVLWSFLCNNTWETSCFLGTGGWSICFRHLSCRRVWECPWMSLVWLTQKVSFSSRSREFSCGRAVDPPNAEGQRETRQRPFKGQINRPETGANKTQLSRVPSWAGGRGVCATLLLPGVAGPPAPPQLQLSRTLTGPGSTQLSTVFDCWAFVCFKLELVYCNLYTLIY